MPHDTKTVSLLRPKRTKKEMEAEMPSVGMDEGPRYPYGTSLSFEKDEIAKIDALKNVPAGAEVVIYAKGKVTEVRVTDKEKTSQKRHRVEIQVTDIAITGKKRLQDMNPTEYREERESK